MGFLVDMVDMAEMVGKLVVVVILVVNSAVVDYKAVIVEVEKVEENLEVVKGEVD